MVTEATDNCDSPRSAATGEPIATLEQAMTWCLNMQATVRFYNQSQGQRIRIAVHTDPRDVERIAVAVQVFDGDDPGTLAAAIESARQDIEPQIGRRLLRLVTDSDPS